MKKETVRSKRVFNIQEDFMEDMDEVSRIQGMLMFPFDPVWYKLMIYFIPFEVLIRSYLCLTYGQDMSNIVINIREILMLYNYLYLLGSLLILVTVIRRPEYIRTSISSGPLVILLIDIISTIPYNVIFHSFAPDMAQYECLGMLNTLKLFRFAYHLDRKRKNINNFRMHIHTLSCIIIICICYMTVLFHGIYCEVYECLYTEEEAILFFWRMSRRTISKWTSTYYAIDKLEIPYLSYEIYIIYWDLCLFIVTRLTSCQMIISMICEYKHKFDYVQKVSYFSNVVAKKFKVSQETHDEVMKYFKVEWKYRSGFHADFAHYNIRNLLPYVLLNEISMDYSWTFFQHSLLFRNVDMHILKQITGFVRKTMHVSGEYIYHKNDLKDKMIYIVSGTVEILSNENSESGVLLLTAGSCLSEANLVIPYECVCNFRCKTTTEIYTLHRGDFLDIIKHYPNDYRILHKTIMRRFEEAKKLIEIKFGETWSDRKDHRNLLFLKNNLHRLLAKTPELFKEHAMENIYLINDLNFKKHMNPWNTKKYLQLLVIYGRRAAKRNLVFFKSNCIWILKPDSPIINIWEYFIVTVAMFDAVILPYCCCINIGQNWFEAFVAIYLLWIIDYCILLLTPVDINSSARTIKAIFEERSRNSGFILDTLCVVPPFFIESYVPKYVLDLSVNWIFCNQLFKMHRIFKLLDRWEKYFYVNILWHTIIKYFLYYFLTTYYLSCIIVLVGADRHIFSLTSIQLVTGNAYLYTEVRAVLTQYFPIFAITDFVIYCLEFLATVSLIGALYLHYNTEKRISEFTKKIVSCSEHYGVKADTKDRLNGFIRTQKNDNKGIMIVHNITTYFNLPVYYRSLIRLNFVPQLLSQIDVLKILPSKYIRELSKYCMLRTYHKHCVIVGKGVVYKNVFVVVQGWTKLVVGTRVYPGRNFQMLNIFTISNGRPAVFSTISITEVCVLSFEYAHFKSVLKDDQILTELFFTGMRCEEYVAVINRTALLPSPIITMKKTDEFNSMFLFTQEALNKSPFRLRDFYRPYEKLKPFSFLRVFFLRRTINPEGKFLFYWECVRCVCAFFSSLLFLNPVLNNSNLKHSYWTFFLMFLDAAGWLDIYVRMHVCYFKEDGILVKHPLYTAKYYLKHSFIVDLIGILPINFISRFWGESISHSVVLNSFRMIQLHRIFGFKRQFMWDSDIFNVIFMLGVMICTINYCCAIALAIDCEYMLYDGDLIIGCDSIRGANNEQLYYKIFYMMTGTMTTLSIASSEVDYFTLSMKHLIGRVGVLGFVGKIFTIGYIFSNRCLNDAEINFLRKYISGLLLLMRKEKVSVYLQKEVAKYYNTYWKVVRSGNPMQLFENLNVILKRDLIYDIFGENLVIYSTFDEDPYIIKTFYKNCLLSVQVETYPVGGYILTVNDVHPYIYFLDRGYVEVIAADGTVLDCLGPGSLFGILENKKYQRQSVSISACTTVQVLYLQARQFFRIIEFFPTIKKNFLLKKYQRMFYIASNAPKMQKRDPNKCSYNRAMVRYRIFQKYTALHSMVACYLGIFLELYQIAVYEMNAIFLLCLYICDIVHLVYVIVYHYVGYMDEDGKLIFDRVSLRKRNMQALKIIFFVITTVPLELFALVIFGRKAFTTYACYYVALRSNRLWRVCFRIWRQNRMIKEYFLTHGESIFKKMQRLWFLLMLYLFSTTCFLIILDRTFGGKEKCSVKFPVVKTWINNLAGAPSHVKFDVFSKYLLFSKMMILLKSDENFYAANWIIENIYVVVMIYAYTYNIVIFGLFFDMMVDYLSTYMYFTTNFKFFKTNKKNHVSNFIRKRLKNQLKMFYSYHYPHYFIIDNTCPNYLNETVRYSIYGYLFENHKIFFKAHVDFVRQLVRHCKVNCYPSRSLIVNKFDDRECMYFIHKGKVVVLKDECDIIDMGIQELTKGMSFGITQGIFPNNPTQHVFKTIAESVILELEFKDWKYLLEFFPATKEFIFYTARILLQESRKGSA